MIVYKTWNDIIDSVIETAKKHKVDSSKILIKEGNNNIILLYLRGLLVAQIYPADGIPF